jgi:hypothetical protein
VTEEAPGVHDLDPRFCDWLESAFRKELGDEAHLLAPPPETAW